MNKGFAQIGYRHDHENHAIVLTKKFSKSSSIVGSKDYNTLCHLRKDFPDYQIVVREIAKKEGKSNPNRNLTYKNMREAIITKHGEDSKELKAFEIVIKESKIHSAPYIHVKAWFLKVYSDACSTDDKSITNN